MKKTLKFFAAGLLFAAFALQSRAQTYENADITASAEVLAALTLTKETDVNFGNLSSSTNGTVFLDPTGTNHAYVGSNATVGKLTIQAEPATQVNITWDESVTLTSGASDELVWNLQVNGNTSDNAAGSLELSLGGGPVTTAEAPSGGNVYWLYVGGELGGSPGSPAQLNQQAAGTYTGTTHFTIAYN